MPCVSSRQLCDRLEHGGLLWQRVVEQVQRHPLFDHDLVAGLSPYTCVQWLDEHDYHLVVAPSGRGSAAFALGGLPPLSRTLPRILTVAQFRPECPGCQGHLLS